MRRSIRFADLAADIPSLGNPGLTQADNCVWTNGCYKQLLALSVTGDALTARCQGAFAGRDSDGNVVIYAGDVTKLYQRVGTAWTDKSGTSYDTQLTQYWKFRQFDSMVVATNFGNNPQKITIGGSGNFADLNADAPKARHVGIIGQFLFLGDTSDSTNGHVPHRVRWSAIGDPDDWPILGTTDASEKQSDGENLNATFGKVMGIADGERFGLVFQENAITRFTYVGGSEIFEVDTYERTRGLIGPFAYAQIGNDVIYLSRNGFYKTNGVDIAPIGVGRVDSLVLDNLDTDYVERISTAIDLQKKLIYFSYPSTSATDGTPDELVIYNYVEDKWTTGSETVELIFSSMELGYTLDQLDTVSGSIDALSISLDSSFWTGGTPFIGGFDTSHEMGSFSGSAKTATLDTGEESLAGGDYSTVNGVRPLIEGGGTVTVSIMTRNLQSDSKTVGSATTLNSRTGFADMRSSSRYHSARVSISGGFDKAIGADFDFEMTSQV